MSQQPECTVAMEACATVHCSSREIDKLGHKVRLIAPNYVKPFVKRQKNEVADAEAIVEAASRTSVQFIALMSAAQQARAMLFCTRQMFIGQRTQTINALRGHLAEHGVVAPKGAFYGSPRGCGLAAGRSGGFRPSCAAGVQWHAAQFRRRSLGNARAWMKRSGCPIWRQRHCATPAQARTPSIELDGLFRQSVFGRLAGYEDVNDADRLALDPVMRQVVGGRAVDAQAASATQMGRFETETLALAENRAALADLNGQWIDRFHDRNGLKYIVLDMDSSVSPTHGDQEGAAWNGHFDCTCYHPNFLFNQFGMLERCALRNG